MAFLDRVIPYAVITLDLNTARTLTAQGSVNLPDGLTTLDAWIANTLLINYLTAGATLTVGVGEGLASAAYGMMTCATGLKIEGIPFTEVFFTNVSQAACTAEVIIAWVD